MSINLRFLAFALLAFSSASLAEATTPGLKVRVQCEPCSIRADESLSIVISLANEGSDPITVFGRFIWGPIGGAELVVIDDAGKTVRVDDHELPSPDLFRDKANFVRLWPMHSFGTIRSEKASDIFPRAGRYRLKVRYVSPVPTDVMPTGLKNAWGRERPRIESPFVVITVR